MTPEALLVERGALTVTDVLRARGYSDQGRVSVGNRGAKARLFEKRVGSARFTVYEQPYLQGAREPKPEDLVYRIEAWFEIGSHYMVTKLYEYTQIGLINHIDDAEVRLTRIHEANKT